MEIPLEIIEHDSKQIVRLSFPLEWDCSDVTLVTDSDQEVNMSEMIARATRLTCPNGESCSAGSSVGTIVGGKVVEALVICYGTSCPVKE